MPLPMALLLVAAATIVVPPGTARAQTACLSSVETQDAVSEKRAVAPVIALRNARVHAGGEVLRARLCRHEETLAYLVTALRKDGKVLRVVVDAVSGSVIETR